MTAKDRAEQKQAVYDKMFALETAELETAIAHYEAHLKGSRLDPTESHDTDEISDARESADLAAAFDQPVQTHHAKVDVLENIDFSVTDTVRPGAIVTIDGRHLVVATATARFDVDGVTYMGISEQSPIYKAMAGLQAGDSFTLNGRDATVDEVF
ncbi:hypothetical protein [Thalassococcus sp. S3]|uniref:hypothetical protein n=1 Tax=Thalassococcus sp. S3 TaxID=2017482 RepID=UPI0010245BB9|nr:hypothetical protein [Thalassococcus sp. S3]QBF32992.1 hypothetical protein CFI11_17445 [Thalassococcus sp. S3]